MDYFLVNTYNIIDGQEWDQARYYIMDRNDPKCQKFLDNWFELSENKVQFDSSEFVYNSPKF